MKKLILFCILTLSIKLNAQVDTIPVTGPSWNDSTITAVIIDNNDHAVIGYNTGLKMYNGTSWDVYQTTTSGLPDDHITAIAQDNSNNYWIGTNNGLAKFDGTNWTVYNTSNSGILDNTITSITTDNTGNIWAGTNSGLSKFDGNTWQSFTIVNSALNTNEIRCLTFSDSLYAGTNTGISVIGTNGITNYNGLYNVNELLAGTDTIWARNPAGIFFFHNGSFSKMEDSYSTCPLQKWLMSSAQPSMASGLNGGITFFYAQILMNFNNDSLSRERMLNFPNTQPRVMRKGNFYYTIELTDSFTLNVIRIDATQTIPDKFSIAEYFGNCPSSELNFNKVRALVLDRADMFWDLTGEAQYEVPKGSGTNALNATSLWIGGKVNGQLRTACQTYRQGGFDYWSGLLDTLSGTNSSSASSLAITKINASEIQEFIINFNNGNVQSGAYTPSQNILDWPATGSGNYSRNVAPFEDVNANGIYDPLTGGDYPIIKGDQMLYHIYNDASGQHLETGGNKGQMGLEIRQSSYAYNCDLLPDSMQALNYTTFFDYTIINRSDSLIDSMYIGYWSDVSLGNNNDDYVGCNVTHNYAYVYNGDNFDEDVNGTMGYHSNLPCLAISVLQSPAAEPNDNIDNDHDGTIDEAGEETALSSFITYNNSADSVTGNPTMQNDYYNLLSGHWKNGNPILYGGNGTTGTQSAKYMFPGDSDPYGYGLGGNAGNPVTAPAWSEISAANIPGDRKIVLSSGPFKLQAKDTVHITYAIVFTPAGSGSVIQQNEMDVAKIRNWYINDSFPACVENPIGIVKQQNVDNSLIHVFPNPATNLVTIQTTDDSFNSIEILDVTGRLVMQNSRFNRLAKLNIESLNSGLYFIKVKSNTDQKTFRLIKE